MTPEKREAGSEDPAVFVAAQGSQTFNIDSRESIAQEKQP